MRRILALGRALAIVCVAALPGASSFFTVKSGERPAPQVEEARGDLVLVGSWDDGDLRLSRVRMLP